MDLAISKTKVISPRTTSSGVEAITTLPIIDIDQLDTTKLDSITQAKENETPTDRQKRLEHNLQVIQQYAKRFSDAFTPIPQLIEPKVNDPRTNWQPIRLETGLIMLFNPNLLTAWAHGIDKASGLFDKIGITEQPGVLLYLVSFINQKPFVLATNESRRGTVESYENPHKLWHWGVPGGFGSGTGALEEFKTLVEEATEETDLDLDKAVQVGAFYTDLPLMSPQRTWLHLPSNLAPDEDQPAGGTHPYLLILPEQFIHKNEKNEYVFDPETLGKKGKIAPTEVGEILRKGIFIPLEELLKTPDGLVASGAARVVAKLADLQYIQLNFVNSTQ